MNTTLKKPLASAMLQIDAMREVLAGKYWPWRLPTQSIERRVATEADSQQC